MENKYVSAKPRNIIWDRIGTWIYKKSRDKTGALIKVRLNGSGGALVKTDLALRFQYGGRVNLWQAHPELHNKGRFLQKIRGRALRGLVDTGEDAFEGQKEQGGDAITMLTFILDETRKEQKQAQETEETAQIEFEESMQRLKDEESKAEEHLSEFHLRLSGEPVRTLTKSRQALVDLAAKTRLSCKFMFQNFDARVKSRQIETEALSKGIKLIKDTPGLVTAVSAEALESNIKCKKRCKKDSTDASCLACLSNVDVETYCRRYKKAVSHGDPLPAGC